MATPAWTGTFFLGLTCFCSTAASARTWHVTHEALGDVSSIQAAIDSSAAGDTVLVGPGTYRENLDLSGKNIWLHSADGPNATLIDGSNLAESAVLIDQGESNECVLEGFTITGGKGHSVGTPTISSCRTPLLIGEVEPHWG